MELSPHRKLHNWTHRRKQSRQAKWAPWQPGGSQKQSTAEAMAPTWGHQFRDKEERKMFVPDTHKWRGAQHPELEHGTHQTQVGIVFISPSGSEDFPHVVSSRYPFSVFSRVGDFLTLVPTT